MHARNGEFKIIDHLFGTYSFLDRRAGVHAMALEYIDIVQLESLQALPHRVENMLALLSV